VARELQIRIEVQDSAAARAALETVETGLKQVEEAGGKTAAKLGNTSSTDSSPTLVGSMKAFRNVAVGLGLGAAVSRVVEFGGRLTDLAAQTGIGVEALQRLDAVGQTVGVGLEQAARGVNMMQRNLVGDEGAQKAVAGLGLEVDALLKMKPDEAFIAIAREIAKIPDPAERTATAVEVLGRSGQQLLPLLLADIEGIGNGVEVMNAKTVAGLDQWDDSWARIKQIATASIGNVVGAFGSWEGAVKLLIDINPFLTESMKTQAKEGFDKFRVAVGEATVSVKTFYEDSKAWLVDKWVAVRDGFRANWQTLAGYVKTAKDAVIGYARELYTGVKTWVVDRFSDIVSGVKTKIDAVTGFFRDMYDKVVGQSYVPDMVRGIDLEFQKLGGIMVKPTKIATDQVVDTFRSMLQNIQGLFSSFGASVSGWLQSMVAGPIGGALGSIVGQVISGLGSLLTGGITSLVNMAVQLVWSGLKKIGSAIKDFFSSTTVEEVKTGFTEQLGFENRDALFKALLDANRMDLINRFFEVDNSKMGTKLLGDWMTDVRAALGFAGGTDGQFLDFGQGRMAMLHGEEAVVRRQDSQGLAEAIAGALGGKVGGGTVQVFIGPRKLAEIIMPELPGVVRRYGLA